MTTEEQRAKWREWQRAWRAKNLTESRREHIREYVKKYRAEHPEKIKQYNLNYMVNLLKKHGYTILKDGVEV